MDQTPVEVMSQTATVLIKGADGARVSDRLGNLEVIIADLASIG